MIVLDTGGLYAALDANERLHGRAVAALVESLGVHAFRSPAAVQYMTGLFMVHWILCRFAVRPRTARAGLAALFPGSGSFSITERPRNIAMTRSR